MHLTEDERKHLSPENLIIIGYKSNVDMILAMCYYREDFAMLVSKNALLMQRINSDIRCVCSGHGSPNSISRNKIVYVGKN